MVGAADNEGDVVTAGVPLMVPVGVGVDDTISILTFSVEFNPPPVVTIHHIPNTLGDISRQGWQ